jgi:hypothetical protein
MKYLKYIPLLLSAFTLNSCDDNNFLSEKPETFYTIDNIFTSQDQVDQCIYTCYVRVRNMFCPYNNWGELDQWSYRMSNGTDMFDVPTIRYSYRFNDYSILNSLSSVYNAVYSNYYYLITSANSAIYAANKDNITWDSEDVKKWDLAQARFFRAFALRNLGELFGGVPIVTEIASTPRYDYERSTRMETYQFAIDELEDIVDDVPETAEAGRIVRAVVYHNLCQLYIDKGVLLEENSQSGKEAYSMAISYADKVINSGQYKLMTERFGSRANEDPEFYFSNNASSQTPEHSYTAAGYHIEGNVFWDLFQENNQDIQQGNTEAIWVSQSDYDLYKEEGDGFRLYYSAIYGPVFRDQGGSYLNGNMEDVGGLGMVQVCPTFYTRDIIYEGKWADDMRNSDAVWRRTFIGNEPGTEYYGKLVPWNLLYKEENGVKNDAAATMLYPISCKIATDKYTGIEDGQNYTALFRDDYLLRLSETILLRAEANWRAGDNAKAASDINMLRERAKCGYKVTAADVNVDLILDERARELVYEESRWNTLLRMGGTIAIDRIKKYSYWACAQQSLANKTFNLWPIPQTVIDTNKDVVIEQNPGW